MSELVDGPLSTTGDARQEALLRAALYLAGDHDVDQILGRMVHCDADVAGARSAALGIYDESGRIERFFHHGIDASAVERIWTAPRGPWVAPRGDRRRRSRPTVRPRRRSAVLRVPGPPPLVADLPGLPRHGAVRAASATCTSPRSPTGPTSAPRTTPPGHPGRVRRRRHRLGHVRRRRGAQPSDRGLLTRVIEAEEASGLGSLETSTTRSASRSRRCCSASDS